MDSCSGGKTWLSCSSRGREVVQDGVPDELMSAQSVLGKAIAAKNMMSRIRWVFFVLSGCWRHTFLKVKTMNSLDQFASEMQRDVRLYMSTLTTDAASRPSCLTRNLVTSATSGVKDPVGALGWRQWCRKWTKETTTSPTTLSENGLLLEAARAAQQARQERQRDKVHVRPKALHAYQPAPPPPV